MPSHALPKRWLPAIKCFANLTAGQLEEKGLPSDSQAVERKLKYIYCDGDAFVFCRGDFIYPDVVKRYVDHLTLQPLLQAASRCALNQSVT